MGVLKLYISAPEHATEISRTFKKKIKKKLLLSSGITLKKVKQKQLSHLSLIFKPVVSRTGTDIDDAIKNIDDNMPAILVVLHHSFDPECIVPKSSPLVKRQHTLVVDCLFYEDKGLLKCNPNKKAYKDTVEWLKSNKKVIKKNSDKTKQYQQETEASSTKPGNEDMRDLS